MKEITKNHRQMFGRIIALAIPVILQLLLVNSVSFADTLMIGQLGSTDIAAVGVAAQVFFLVTMFLYGVSSGGGIFISQFWGAEDRPSIHKIMGITILFTTVVVGIVSLYSSIFPSSIMRLFTQEQDIIAGGNTYLKIVGFSYVCTGISYMYATGLRSTGDTKTPLIISIVALTIDILGNYLLIFGISFFPRLGIAGAAISTALSRTIELLLYIIITSKNPLSPIRCKMSSCFHLDKAFVKKFFTYATPVIINDIFWAIGLVFYKIAFAKIGSNALAAVQIVESINNLFIVIIQGYAGAVAIIIGHLIGAGREKEARKFENSSLVFSLVTGLCVALIVILISPTFVTLFNIEKEVSSIAIKSLFMISFLLPFKSFNIAAIIGLIRAGGDTKFAMYLELGSMWIVGVPLAFIGVLYWGLSLPQVYLLTGAEEAVKLLFELKRIKSGKYIHNIIQ